MTSKRSLLVTGANGFLGRAVVCAARRSGFRVTSLVRDSASPFTYSDDTVHHRFAAPADLAHVIDTHMVDTVIHAAGSASVQVSMHAPLRDFEANACLTSHVLEAVRLSRRKPHTLALSSAAVYGDAGQVPTPESLPRAPVSPYGYSKAMAELLCEQYATIYELKTTSLRIFSVVGPNQRRLLPYELWERATNEETITLRGSGHESRDYLHEADVASAVIGLAERGGPQGHEVLNVASGAETTVRDLACTIRDLVAPGKAISFSGHTISGDPVRWCADIAELRKALPSWRPMSVQSAIKSSVDNWGSTHEPMTRRAAHDESRTKS